MHDSQQHVLNVVRKYDRTALLIVDWTGVLDGIVRRRGLKPQNTKE
jgi:hypothetical protein